MTREFSWRTDGGNLELKRIVVANGAFIMIDKWCQLTFGMANGAFIMIDKWLMVAFKWLIMANSYLINGRLDGS